VEDIRHSALWAGIWRPFFDRPRMVIESKSAKSKWTLEHRAEKWNPVFGKIRCSNKEIDRHFASVGMYGDRNKQGRKRPAARFRPLSTRGKGRYTQIGFGAAFIGAACLLTLKPN
jgi:hypothetical protein